jgi:PIN domain nuclease of toxin-antitoxin system
MKLLIDTHVFLWFIFDDPQLTIVARSLIEDGDNDVFLSVASAWEMAIKAGMGRLPLTQPVGVFIPEQMQRTGIQLLPISMKHALHVAGLSPHHRDPFDRLLISQSLLEAIPIVSIDAKFDAYGVDRRF